MDLWTNNAWVNLSGTLIPVYSSIVPSDGHVGTVTAGGSQIGTIYVNEYYTLIGEQNNVTSRKINFRNSAGQWTYGYIETSPGYTFGDYAWVKYQQGFADFCVSADGSSLAPAGSINGYYAHGLRRSVTVLHPNGNYSSTLWPGLIIGAVDSHCGDIYSTFMKFEKVSYDGAVTWQDLTSDGSGYVDLQLASGSMPSNRSVL